MEEVHTPGTWAGISPKGRSLTTETDQISFQTTDSPGAVFTFYISVLNKDGWADSTPLVGPKTERDFQLLTGDPETAFDLRILTNSEEGAATRVQILVRSTHPGN